MQPPAPKIDREALRKRLMADFERALDATVDALEAARPGKIIRDSELPAHKAGRELTRRIYEAAVQAQVDAAEAASPPSTGREREAAAEQRPPKGR